MEARYSLSPARSPIRSSQVPFQVVHAVVSPPKSLSLPSTTLRSLQPMISSPRRRQLSPNKNLHTFAPSRDGTPPSMWSAAVHTKPRNDDLCYPKVPRIRFSPTTDERNATENTIPLSHRFPSPGRSSQLQIVNTLDAKQTRFLLQPGVANRLWFLQRTGCIIVRDRSGKDVCVIDECHQSGKALCMCALEETVWVGYSSGSIKVFDARTHRLITETNRHSCGVVTLTPVFGYVASGGSDFIIHLWDAITGMYCMSFKGHTNSITALASSRSFLFSGSADTSIRVWNTAVEPVTCVSCVVPAICTVTPGSVLSLLSIDESQEVWAGYEDGGIRIFGMEELTLIVCLTQHTKSVTCIAYLGGEAFTGGADEYICVWSWRTHEHLRSVSCHTGYITCLSLITVSSTQTELWSVGSDQRIKCWSLRTVAGKVGGGNPGAPRNAPLRTHRCTPNRWTSRATCLSCVELKKELRLSKQTAQQKIEDLQQEVSQQHNTICIMNERLENAYELIRHQNVLLEHHTAFSGTLFESENSQHLASKGPPSPPTENGSFSKLTGNRYLSHESPDRRATADVYSNIRTDGLPSGKDDLQNRITSPATSLDGPHTTILTKSWSTMMERTSPYWGGAVRSQVPQQHSSQGDQRTPQSVWNASQDSRQSSIQRVHHNHEFSGDRDDDAIHFSSLRILVRKQSEEIEALRNVLRAFQKSISLNDLNQSQHRSGAHNFRWSLLQSMPSCTSPTQLGESPPLPRRYIPSVSPWVPTQQAPHDIPSCSLSASHGQHRSVWGGTQHPEERNRATSPFKEPNGSCPETAPSPDRITSMRRSSMSKYTSDTAAPVSKVREEENNHSVEQQLCTPLSSATVEHLESLIHTLQALVPVLSAFRNSHVSKECDASELVTRDPSEATKKKDHLLMNREDDGAIQNEIQESMAMFGSQIDMLCEEVRYMYKELRACYQSLQNSTLQTLMSAASCERNIQDTMKVGLREGNNVYGQTSTGTAWITNSSVGNVSRMSSNRNVFELAMAITIPNVHPTLSVGQLPSIVSGGPDEITSTPSAAENSTSPILNSPPWALSPPESHQNPSTGDSSMPMALAMSPPRIAGNAASPPAASSVATFWMTHGHRQLASGEQDSFQARSQNGEMGQKNSTNLCSAGSIREEKAVYEMNTSSAAFFCKQCPILRHQVQEFERQIDVLRSEITSQTQKITTLTSQVAQHQANEQDWNVQRDSFDTETQAMREELARLRWVACSRKQHIASPEERALSSIIYRAVVSSPEIRNISSTFNTWWCEAFTIASLNPSPCEKVIVTQIVNPESVLDRLRTALEEQGDDAVVTGRMEVHQLYHAFQMLSAERDTYRYVMEHMRQRLQQEFCGRWQHTVKLAIEGMDSTSCASRGETDSPELVAQGTPTMASTTQEVTCAMSWEQEAFENEHHTVRTEFERLEQLVHSIASNMDPSTVQLLKEDLSALRATYELEHVMDIKQSHSVPKADSRDSGPGGYAEDIHSLRTNGTPSPSIAACSSPSGAGVCLDEESPMKPLRVRSISFTGTPSGQAVDEHGISECKTHTQDILHGKKTRSARLHSAHIASRPMITPTVSFSSQRDITKRDATKFSNEMLHKSMNSNTSSREWFSPTPSLPPFPAQFQRYL